MSLALQLIRQNNLKQADAVILRKKFIGMVDHYAIFLGYDRDTGVPCFVANYTAGVRLIENHELNEFLKVLEPTHIERFEGSESERKKAVERGVSRIGEDAYDYFKNNCESFKNFVQKGINYSKQAENFNTGAKIVAGGSTAIAIAALATKNPKLAAWAGGIAALAGLAALISESDDDN